MKPRAKVAGCLALAATLLVVAGPAQTEAALPARPDLTATKVSVSPLAVTPPAALRLSSSTKNVGRARAAASKTAFFLSRDRKRDARDVRLGRARVKSLRARRAARAKASLRVPPSVPAGVYYVVACADTARKLRESKEKNNCAASAKRVRVNPSPGGGNGAGGPPGGNPLPGGPLGGNPLPGRPPSGNPSGSGPPLDVSVQQDLARASTERIGEAGGSVTATGADGTTFTLTIPEGALRGEKTIAVTPLNAIGGYPFNSGPPRAVQLAPEGVKLLKPATLLIEPAGSPPSSDVVAFGWRGGGSDFHLHPLGAGSEISLSLMHFSGYGAGPASATEVAQQATRGPRSLADALDQSIAQAQRTGASTSGPMADYANKVLGPRVQSALAGSDEGAIDTALYDILAWNSLAQLLGLLDDNGNGELKPERDRLYPKIADLVKKAYDLAFARCPGSEPYIRMLGVLRQSQLLGLDDGLLDESKLDQCVPATRFRVTYVGSGTTRWSEKCRPTEGDRRGSTETETRDMRWDIGLPEVSLHSTGGAFITGPGEVTETNTRTFNGETTSDTYTTHDDNNAVVGFEPDVRSVSVMVASPKFLETTVLLDRERLERSGYTVPIRGESSYPNPSENPDNCTTTPFTSEWSGTLTFTPLG